MHNNTNLPISVNSEATLKEKQQTLTETIVGLPYAAR